MAILAIKADTDSSADAVLPVQKRKKVHRSQQVQPSSSTDVIFRFELLFDLLSMDMTEDFSGPF